MKELTREQIEYAVTRLVKLVEHRGITQTQLEQLSGVNQSTISKILAPTSEHVSGPRYTPSEEILEKLFKGLSLRLATIINETDRIPTEIAGYLATPLTGLSLSADTELRRVVKLIRTIAAENPFDSPRFDIYWPGDYTHPRQHAEISPKQVYEMDRSRAASHDFIILLCATPSFGVGQENEIATQAGIPAIRLLPEGTSRMMIGSFIDAFDITLSGSLEAGIRFDADRLRVGFAEIRKTYFRHQALYQKINGDGFGPRLRKLISDRCGDYRQFAADLGISVSYLHALMEEPFSVSNPSASLLKRIARRLGERVAYLIGETEENDPVWIESNSSWRSWVDGTPDLDARITLKIRDDWRHEYAVNRREAQTSASFRKSVPLMREADWDKRYQRFTKSVENGDHDRQPRLL